MKINFTNRGDSTDTIKAMQKAVEIGRNYLGAIKLAKSLPNDEREIFNFVFENICYVPDENGNQTVRTLKRSLKEGIGNCVDYSVCLATILSLKGIPCYFKKISQTGKGFDHVYVITDNHVLDAVQGQDQSGSEYLKPNYLRTPKFNQEVKNIKKFKIYKVI